MTMEDSLVLWKAFQVEPSIEDADALHTWHLNAGSLVQHMGPHAANLSPRYPEGRPGRPCADGFKQTKNW